jgi:SP family general alpha glucoside:H+ symporter-like MFS transporter
VTEATDYCSLPFCSFVVLSVLHFALHCFGFEVIFGDTNSIMAHAFERLPTGDTRCNERPSIDAADEHLSYDPHNHRRIASTSSSHASLLDHKPSLTAKTTKLQDRDSNNLPLGKSIRQNSKLVWWMLGMSIALLYAGFDSVVLSVLNTNDAYKEDFGEWLLNDDPDPEKAKMEWIIPGLWLSLWDGIGPLGQIAGTALGGWFMERFGRKFCLMVGSVIGAVGILDFFLSNKPGDKEMRRIMLLVGKVIQGFGLGVIRVSTMTYMSEVVPTTLKGPIMSMIPTFMLIGQLIGAVVVKFTGDIAGSWSYLVPLASQWVVALPVFLMAIFMPESPAYFLHKKDSASALRAFRRLYGHKHDARAAVDNMEETMQREAVGKADEPSYWDCFKDPANRRRTFISMFAGSIEFLFGLSLLSSVATFLNIMGMAKGRSQLFMIGGIIIGMFVNFGSSWTTSHFGRRQLITTSFLISAALWGVMGFAGIKQFPWTPWFAGGLMIGVIVACGLGCWPASYALLGEVSSLRLRSRSMSLGALMNNLTGIVANFGQPMLFAADKLDLGAKTGFVFAGLSLFGALFTYFFVPELKGRSAIENDRFFAKGIRSIGSTKWRDTHDDIPMDDA